MPDLHERYAKEDELAALILAIFIAARDEAILLLGDPPNARNLTAEFWNRLANDLRETLQAHMLRIYGVAFDRMHRDEFPVIDDQIRDTLAEEWAAQKATQVVIPMIGHTKDLVSKAVQDHEQSVSAATAAIMAAAGLTAIQQAERRRAAIRDANQQLKEQLEGRAFSEERARAIAVTETTGAVTAGEVGFIGELEAAYDGYIESTSIWITERDERVCPLCEPLDGKPGRIWREAWPSGPPRHPICRCHLEWIVFLLPNDRDQNPDEIVVTVA